MRFRHRRGFRRRVPSQWVTSVKGYAQTQAQGSALTVALSPVQALLLGADALPGTGANPPQINRFRVETIVGQVDVPQIAAGSGASVYQICMGIIVLKRSVGSVVVVDPASTADAQSDWMYLKSWCVVDALALGNDASLQQDLPLGAFLKTKTKRVIRENEDVWLCVSMTLLAGAGGGQFLVMPRLRTLITRVA